MKKLSIFILGVILVFFATLSITYASTGDPLSATEIEDEITWTISDTLDGYTYIKSNRFLIDFDTIYIELGTGMAFEGEPDWANFIIATAGTHNSNITAYADELTTTEIESFIIDYESPGVTELMFSYNELGDPGIIETTDLKNAYFEIVLFLDLNATETQITNLDLYLNNYMNAYDFNIDVQYIIQNVTVAGLPNTTGNPYLQTGTTGEVYDWAYSYITNTFSGTVRYFQDYRVSIGSVSFGDDAFLDRVESIDYYTVDDQKYLQFNFIGSDDNVLLPNDGSFAERWNAFALWNLTTNELIVYNKALVLTYIEVTDNREVFGYIYTPGIPMEDLIAVSGSFNYRYGSKNLIGVQQYGDWRRAVFGLEKDQESYGSQDIFEGALPQWSYDYAMNSIAALGVGLALSFVPGLNVIAMPLMFTSMAMMVSSVTVAIDHVVTGQIDEIVTLTPSTTLQTTLNTHFTEVTGTQTIIPSNAQVHRLFYGLFTAPDTNVVDIDDSSLIYTEITWATNGQVYTLDETLIDSQAILDMDYSASLPPEGSLSWFEINLGQYALTVIISVIVILILLILPKIEAGIKSLGNILKYGKVLIVIGIIGFLILLYTGVI